MKEGGETLKDTIAKLFRPSNIGTAFFFALNFGLIFLMFYPYSFTPYGLSLLLSFYVITVVISLSPVGEWMLSVFAGAKEIKRKDVKLKLIPLLEAVYNNAKDKSPNMVDSIHLKIISGMETNAYAIGRRTICVTEGVLNLPDEMIMGIFAHEIGHIANRHSQIQLLIGGTNFFISTFILILKLIAWMITGLFGLFALGTRRLQTGCLIGLVGSISTILVYLWVKFCRLFLMWSSRKNEFAADEYAYSIGFGNQLAYVLDNIIETPTKNGFLKALYSSHPDRNERIARLQELGAQYSRW